MKTPKLLGIHAKPGRKLNAMLVALPFILLIASYLIGSNLRLQRNEHDKVMPSLSRIWAGIERVALSEHPRTGKIMIVQDTLVSLQRMGLGLSVAALCALIVGLNAGMFPGLRPATIPLVTFMSTISPIALLPILLVAFKGGEMAKPTFIFLGTVLVMMRDIYNTVERIPKEQITQVLTLGAGQLNIVYEVVLPQIMPRLLTNVRLALGPAWIYLIASEAMGANAGLGHQIFLQSRLFNMDVVIPYVLWITFIGFVMDTAFRKFIEWKYLWYRVR